MGYVPPPAAVCIDEANAFPLRKVAELLDKSDRCSCCGGKLVATGMSKWKSCSKCSQWFEETWNAL